MDITACPECFMAAEVVDKYELESSDGLVTHIRTACINRHFITQIAK